MPDERITPPNAQYEIMAHHIDINATPPDTPVQLPEGWVPLQGIHIGNDFIVIMYREVA